MRELASSLISMGFSKKLKEEVKKKVEVEVGGTVCFQDSLNVHFISYFCFSVHSD